MKLPKRVYAAALLALLASLVSHTTTEHVGAQSAPAPRENKGTTMPTFSAPMINLYSRDLSRAVAFYSGLGFVESFRTPASSNRSMSNLRKMDLRLESRPQRQLRESTAFDRKEKGAGSKSSFGLTTRMPQ